MSKKTKTTKSNLPVTLKLTTPKPVISAPVKQKRNSVSLEFLSSSAKKVCVAGSFNEWKPEQTPLVSTGNGRWVGQIPIGPGRHEYLFVVDGQWIPDPNAQESVRNPFGGTNSVLTISE
jgi:1,4-alpha-glucan branching enzyme